MQTLGAWVRERPFTPEQAAGWMVRLAKGLLVLHELDVSYGRVTRHCVKCESPDPRSRAILLDADEVKRDFHFYSLERIERAGASKDDDVWALGVLLYHLVTGGYPFPGDSRVKVGERIKWAPASPIAVYEADHPDVQRVLDRAFKEDEGLRLASLPLLVDALVLLDRKTDLLPPLELGVVVGDDLAALDAAYPPAPSPVPAALVSEDIDAPDAIDDAPTVAGEEGASFPFPQLPESRTSEPPPAGPDPFADADESADPGARLALSEVPSGESATKGEAAAESDEAAFVKQAMKAPSDSTKAIDWTRPPPIPRRAPKRSAGWLWVVVGALVGIAVVVYLQQRFAAADATHQTP